MSDVLSGLFFGQALISENLFVFLLTNGSICYKIKTNRCSLFAKRLRVENEIRKYRERKFEMKTKDLRGKHFLEHILKMEAQLDEKNDELLYWKKQKILFGEDEMITKNIEKRAEELQKMLIILMEQKLSATKMIDSVEDPIGRAILRRRYILCDTWKKIASACGKMSERNAHYIHDQALLDFEKIYCGIEAVFI